MFHVKSGALLGSFEVADRLPLQDLPHLVAAVSDGTATSSDSADLIIQLESYVNVSDFPSLLNLLIKHRSAFALFGESLGVTDRVTHCITLKPDARTSYVLVPSPDLSQPSLSVWHHCLWCLVKFFCLMRRILLTRQSTVEWDCYHVLITLFRLMYLVFVVCKI